MRKSQLDHVHSWLQGSCSERYSSTCPSSSEVEVQRISVPEEHPYIGYMLLSYWLAVKVATAFSLVGHQIGWIKYGLGLSHHHLSRGFPHQRLLTFEKAVFLRGNQVIPLVVLLFMLVDKFIVQVQSKHWVFKAQKFSTVSCITVLCGHHCLIQCYS